MKFTLALLFVAALCISSAAGIVIEKGDSGDDVYAVQYLLLGHGIYVGVDGDFGPGTESGVKTLQGSNGHYQNGVVSGSTYDTLIISTMRGGPNTNVNKAVQWLLKYKFSTYSSSIDGDFGAGTEVAVRSFQTSKNLSADGQVGPSTWSKLFSTEGIDSSGSTHAALAAQILARSNISLQPVHGNQSSSAQNSPNYAISTALKNVEHQAAGIKPYTSCYGNAPCLRADMSITMMNCILAISDQMSISISSIVGSSHSSTSKHYKGWAVDMNYVGGVHVAPSGAGLSNALAAANICSQFGAYVLHPNNEPNNHHNHIHCQWNANNA